MPRTATGVFIRIRPCNLYNLSTENNFIFCCSLYALDIRSFARKDLQTRCSCLYCLLYCRYIDSYVERQSIIVSLCQRRWLCKFSRRLSAIVCRNLEQFGIVRIVPYWLSNWNLGQLVADAGYVAALSSSILVGQSAWEREVYLPCQNTTNTYTS